MVCINCSHETSVSNSRLQKRSNTIWRRRRCILCDTVFTTIEVADYTKSIVVRSRRDNSLHPLLRDRLLLSLYKSLGHRTDPLGDAGGLCDSLLNKIVATTDNGVVSDSNIITIVSVALNRFDSLAAQHYQAFHKI